MVAVISNPKYLEDIDNAVNQMNKEIVIKKIDRDIDIMEEREQINSSSADLLILDISCVEDCKKIPHFIKSIQDNNENIRIIIIAPYSLSGNVIINDLISMGIYDIIGQQDNAKSHILSELLEIYENPSTYAKATKWDREVANRSKQEKEFIDSGTGRFGKKREDIITIEKNKIVGTVVIAVVGIIPRIGTTHTAISLANFLLKNKNGVAVVEMQHSNTFDSIKNSYTNVEQKRGLFSLLGIDFYPYDPSLQVSDLILGDYDYVVLDMGSYDTCDVTEFKRAQERIIVCGGKDWEINELDNFLKNEKKISSNKYLFSFCNDSIFEFIQSNMESLSCYQAAYNPQPFDDDDKTDEVFEQILSYIIPKTKDGDEGILSLLKKKEKLQHKPILLKRVEIKVNEKEEFLKYMMFILFIAILLIGVILILVNTPMFSGIKEYFTKLLG